MTLSREALWTLDELCAQVALALAEGYPGQSSGRVREVPDRRTIRFYSTLGLLDRPAGVRGRTALYGPRHLRQLVAIKRLQANGLTLAEVQARLVGQTDDALAELPRLPDDLASGGVRNQGAPPHPRSPDPGEAEGADRRDGAFWKAAPAPAGEVLAPLVGVPWADGATLLLEAARALDEHDLEALRAAAAPLLRLLEGRRLLRTEK
jgi:DNA-binding transcriptional MerR regulator